ncbi:MAG TPA: hypothetical protein VGG74_21405 [Kofleriaceae bacterium]
MESLSRFRRLERSAQHDELLVHAVRVRAGLEPRRDVALDKLARQLVTFDVAESGRDVALFLIVATPRAAALARAYDVDEVAQGSVEGFGLVRGTIGRLELKVAEPGTCDDRICGPRRDALADVVAVVVVGPQGLSAAVEASHAIGSFIFEAM